MINSSDYNEYKNNEFNYQCYLCTFINKNMDIEFSCELRGHILFGRYAFALEMLEEIYPKKEFLNHPQFIREKRLGHLLDEESN